METKDLEKELNSLFVATYVAEKLSPKGETTEEDIRKIVADAVELFNKLRKTGKLPLMYEESE